MYAYAASGGQAVAQELLATLNEVILYPLITLMMAIALLIFLYGAFEYVRGAASDGDREKGRRHLLWGIIGMLVMLSALSILYVAAGTFDLQDELDGARDDGRAWNGGFFNSYSEDDFNDNRAPSDFGLDDEPEEFVIGDGSGEEDITHPDSSFVAADSVQFRFYTAQISSAYGSEVEFDQVVGYIPTGVYADDYIVELAPQCRASGGSRVIKIAVNSGNGAQFYCLR